MRIEPDIKLDFDDVLLKPKRSTIVSRADVELVRTFQFRNGRRVWTGVPIISANMTTVTTSAVAVKMGAHQMLSCVPKGVVYRLPNTIHSIGLNTTLLPSYSNDFLCLDVPNGYIEIFLLRIAALRKLKPEIVLIAGNVVSAEMTEAILLAGADIVKVGLGSGSACSTRIKTGVGYPQLSAVIECADAAHGLGGHIISDGGCVTPGDVVKAFAAGADFVMLGGMLAGCTENGTEFYGMASKKANELHAGGLKYYRAVEGLEFELSAKGSIELVLQEIEGGLRSACAYVGAKRLKDLPKCATFVQVQHQANTSLWGYRK
jgi:GMP reductase